MAKTDFTYTYPLQSEAVKAGLRQYTDTASLPEEIIPSPDWLHRNRYAVESAYAAYSQELSNLNAAIIPYLSAEKKQVYQQRLRMLIWFSYLKTELDTIESRRYRLPEYESTRQKATDLLQGLQGRAVGQGAGKFTTLEPVPTAHPATRYLGIKAAQLLMQIIMKLEDCWRNNRQKFHDLLQSWQAGKTQYLIDWMSEINGLRLYWVWGNAMLDTVFQLANKMGRIDDRFFAHLEKVLQSPGSITGNLSWILYFSRFSLGFSLLLKHAVPGPWMSKKEREILWYKRLDEQWRQRKFQLLNDGIWGVTNLATFFWLTYRTSPRLGMVGDYLTALLLVMDLCLTCLKYVEEKEKYEKNLQNMYAEKRAMEAVLKKEPDNAVLKEHIAKIDKDISQLKIDWYYSKLNMYNEIFYAAALLLSFCLLIGLFVPGGQAAPLMIILVGAVACFALTVLQSTIRNVLPLFKTGGELKRTKAEYEKLLAEFNDCPEGDRKKELTIRLVDMEKQILYQKKMMLFQVATGLRSLIIDTLTPVVVLVSLMFMPIGVGIGTLSAAFVLAVASKFAINRFKPKAPEPTASYEKAQQFFTPNQPEKSEASEKQDEKTEQETEEADTDFQLPPKGVGQSK